jgi:iron(III) transport system ATP-binding protein
MIRFEAVSKQYGSATALRAITFAVETGELVVLRGPSGSGKTTLLRLVAGLDLPDEGQIFLNGQIASTPEGGLPPYRRSLGMVFQQASLWPHLTVLGNLRYPLLGQPAFAVKSRLEELLAQTGLQKLADRYPAQLSGGEQRTAALARALAARPGLFLFDEPLTSLDAVWKDRLLSLILEITRTPGVTTLYVTHDEVEAAHLSGRVLNLQHGNLVE